eukprot:scaffold1248_cov122-Isochrysis_galbana.AAC.7
MSVAFGPIPHEGKPDAPYPSGPGMVSSRSSPTVMPMQPWSHPLMSWPMPYWQVNGSCPGSLVDQNFLPEVRGGGVEKGGQGGPRWAGPRGGWQGGCGGGGAGRERRRGRAARLRRTGHGCRAG